MNSSSKLTKVGLAGAGLVAGIVLAGTIGARAATTSPSASTSNSTTTDAHPGDNGADGVAESQEHHGGDGGGVNLSGTVTAVGSGSLTIKTATATSTYTVPGGTDIDKNGEAALSALAVGDVVTFSVDRTNAKQIEKLHAGDEAKNMPSGTAPSSSSSSTTTG